MVRLKDPERVVGAITAAVVAYITETDKPTMAAVMRRKLPSGSNSWGSSGRDEIMRMGTLWQRRIVSKLPASSYWSELKA